MSAQTDFGHIPERTIGRRLRDAREDTGMSQAQFAEATGLSQRSISRYEQATSDAEIKRPVLLSWAFATNVPFIWLQTGSTRSEQGGTGSVERMGYGLRVESVPERPFRPRHLSVVREQAPAA